MFSFIIFVSYYILTYVNWLSWQGVVVLILMTWVRAPGLHVFNIILPLTFTCRFNLKVHDTPSESSVHASWSIRSKALDWRTPYTLVNVCTRVLKSQRGHQFEWAWIAIECLLIWDLNPLWFAILPIFFIIFIFYFSSFNYCFSN